MQEANSCNSTSDTHSRDNCRRYNSAVREKQRSEILKHNRPEFSNVEKSMRDITLDEFKDIVLKFKQRGSGKNRSLEILHQIKKSICSGDEYIEAFFKIDGAFATLVSLLIGKDAQKQLEAAACLTNLACSSHKSCCKIAKRAGAYLVLFMNGDSLYMQDQCAWTAGNIVNDCYECFSILKAQGLLPALLKLLESSMSEVIHSATFALCACTKYEDSDMMTLAGSATLAQSFLKVILQGGVNRGAIADASFGLANCYYLAGANNFQNFTPDAADIILNCLDRCTKESPIDILIATPLLRCLGYFGYQKNSVCEYISVHNFFNNVINQIMCSHYHHLKKELLWVLNNILVSEDLDMDYSTLNNIINTIKSLLNPLDSALYEALYCIALLAHKDAKFVSLLIEAQVPPQLASLTCDKNTEIVANYLISLIESKTC